MQQLNHTSSQLLHDQENNTLHRLIGQKSECLSMAVIQLFFTRPPTHTQWFKENAGVLCFIKDNVRREFTFRLYNMDYNYNTVVFEEDLQADMEYNEDNNFFHTVQTDHRIVAFNFANNYEASIMNTKVQERLQWLRSRLQNQMNPPPRLISTTSKDMHYQIKKVNYTNSAASNPITLKKLITKNKSGKISKINKNDISQPSNFVHTLHYGINMESNFALEDCPIQLRNALQDVNITNQQLQNPEIRELIRNTLDQMPDINQNEYNHNEIQKEIEREESYMIRHMTRKKVKSPQMDLLTKIKSNQFNIHNEIEREENYMERYKTERSVPSRELASPMMHTEINLMDFAMPQEKTNIRRPSNSGEIGLQIATDQSELFTAVNYRRSKEATDGTRKQQKLPQRQPSLKNHNRPLALPQRKDSKLTIPRLKHKTYNMAGRPLPLIPVQDNYDEQRKASQVHANKHDLPRGPPPPSPNKRPPQPPTLSNVPPSPPPPPTFPLDDNVAYVQKSTDGRAALFDAIKQGSTLKPPDLSQSKTSSAGLGTSRNDLMNAIRSGKQLNPVQARNPTIEENDVEALNTHGNDLAAALSRALKIRNVAMQSDDDSSTNKTEDSDDEWDA